MNEFKACNTCKQIKSLNEYYRHGKYYMGECKECAKARTRSHPRWDRRQSSIESEMSVLSQLNRMGIPALPGKTLSHQYADIIAHGCLQIEVKSSRNYGNDIHSEFQFAFTPKQRRDGIRGDLIVLVCRWIDKYTYHVFPTLHPAFFLPTGERKTAVGWHKNKHPAGRKSDTALTDDLMEMAQDNWALVEQYRQKIVERLKAGATLPIVLSKGEAFNGF